MLELKQAVFEDAQAITAIKVRAYNREINTYLHRDGGPEGYDSVDSQRDILQRYPVWRIELDGALIGALFVVPQEGGAMRLEDFVIDPAHQGRGYGRRVLALLDEAYPQVRVWTLCTPEFSAGNRHLYETSGYTPVGEHDGLIEYRRER